MSSVRRLQLIIEAVSFVRHKQLVFETMSFVRHLQLVIEAVSFVRHIQLVFETVSHVLHAARIRSSINDSRRVRLRFPIALAFCANRSYRITCMRHIPLSLCWTMGLQLLTDRPSGWESLLQR